MVQFTRDPGTDVFIRGIDAGERARRHREQVGIDTAIRAALAQQQTAQPPSPALAPAAAPQAPVSAPTAPAAPPPPPPPPPAPPVAPPAEPEPPGGSGVPDSIPPAAEAPQAPWPPAAPARPTTSAPRAPAPVLSPGPAAAPPASPVAAFSPATDRYDAIVQNLARTPGGGVAALGVMREQDRAAAFDARRRDMLTRHALTAYAKGDRMTGDYFAGQAGVTLPPVFGGGGGRGGGGRAARGAKDPVSQAALFAKDWYGEDMGRAQKFMQAFLSSGGDLQAAIEAGGPFTGRASNIKPQWVDTNDGRQQLFVITPGGQTKPVTDASGEGVYRQGAAAGGGRGGAAGAGGTRQFAIDRKYAYLVQSGMDEREAARVAGGGTISANARAQLVSRIQTDVAKNIIDFDTPEKQAAEVQRRIAEIDAILGTPAAPAPGPRPANLPQAQTDRPATPALTPQAQVPGAAAPAAPASAAATSPAQARRIPQAAVDRLRANPHEAALFDQHFGAGAAAKVLGR